MYITKRLFTKILVKTYVYLHEYIFIYKTNIQTKQCLFLSQLSGLTLFENVPFFWIQNGFYLLVRCPDRLFIKRHIS